MLAEPNASALVASSPDMSITTAMSTPVITPAGSATLSIPRSRSEWRRTSVILPRTSPRNVDARALLPEKGRWGGTRLPARNPTRPSIGHRGFPPGGREPCRRQPPMGLAGTGGVEVGVLRPDWNRVTVRRGAELLDAEDRFPSFAALPPKYACAPGTGRVWAARQYICAPAGSLGRAAIPRAAGVP